MAKPKITLTAHDHARISAAVTAAESHSCGEITTILADQSDSYHDITLIWSALVALSIAPNVYLGAVDRLMGWWGSHWQASSLFALATGVVTVKFAAMWLLLRWRWLRLALVPGPIKHARVRARAVTCYRIATDQRTAAATGILIYLSRAERRAEIVADPAISARVPPEVWGTAMASLLDHIRQDRLADGLIAAIGQAGAVLAEHFPGHEDDINELPDRLIEV